MKIWLDGGLQDGETARVSVFDHGLTVGDGVFETVKAMHGETFALTRHLDRLTRSARGLGLPDPDQDEIRRACAAVLEADPMPLGRLRITYTGGHGPLGSDRGDRGPTLVVALGGTTRRADSTAVVTVPWTRNERGALTGLKTTSYAENVVALARAHEQGATEALFGNTAGRLCEGTGSNVFVVVDGEIHTPAGGLRLPRGDHARADRRVDRRQRDRPAAGRAGTGRRGLPHLHAARRPGRPPGRRP
ncbi:branched-subunit amino acid aminotransferase/4-amino-4-deoxychorismate lyase [Streptomyces sp. B4I13]|nr:branched-subunit amino acid aminotransferase/4-amino-4-deoxychorismate lyase [Streptomyces sp. B4I13]